MNGDLSLKETDIEWTFDDVETLNRAAKSGTYDITKLSFHAFLLVSDTYRLLRSGSALGFNCGPVLVSKRPISIDEIPMLKVVLPGELTTAHLLFRLFCPSATNKRFVRYDEIIPSVKNGEADAGVIIHEDRFTFESKGLRRVLDLGEWWEKQTNCPIPLGCMAIRRTLGDTLAYEVDTLIRTSILYAESDKNAAMPFILRHAVQTDPGVVQQHVDTFVSEFSKDLGEQGDLAVKTLFDMAKDAGVIS